MSRDATLKRAVPGARARRTPPHAAWTRTGLLALCVVALLAFTLHSLRLSDASFTAASANGPNLFVAGSLGHVNSQDGRVMVNATGMQPGDVQSGTMTLTGTGTLAGDYTLAPLSLVDAPASPALSQELNLTIEDTTGAPVVLFDDPVAALDADDPVVLGSIAPGATRSYEVTLEYPDGPAVGPLQGASMTLVLQVTEVSQ